MAKKKSGRGGGRGGSKSKKGSGGGKGGGSNGKKSTKKSISLADDFAVATNDGVNSTGSATSTTPLTRPTASDATNSANGREAKARDDAETKLIARLYTLSRSLLASLSGCAPDGSPLAEPSHPLAKLHQQLLDQVDVLMKMQSDDSNRLQPWRNMAGGDDEKEKNEEGVEQHQQQRSAGSFTNRANPEAWSAFASWLSECGISPSKNDFPVEIRPSVVTVSSDDDSNDQEKMVEYGLFATRDIAYDEVVLRLPMETMMCPYFEHVLEKSTEEDETKVVTSISSLLPPPFDPNRPVAQDMQLRPLCLITHLVNERYRGRASVFAPYLDTLPECTSTPLYWGLEEIRSLKQTAHLKRAVMMQAKLIWEYVQAREMIDQTHQERSKGGGAGSSDATIIPTRDFTFELFRWATATAHSRQNLIPFPVKNSRRAATVAASPAGGNEEGGEEADIDVAHGLVPLWDLLNHEDSDRACQTDVIFERIDGDQSRLRAVLVCQTPPDAPKGNPLCFHAGEEVTMHYGKRSNAQLLYHSGFVNCIVETSDTEGNGEVRGGEQINRNRSDCALLRVALPPAEDDAGLDRIRERVAARFGFRAYANQGCEHDGIACANAAATILAENNGGTDKENQTKQPAGARKATEVVMTEFAVSSHDALPEGLSRALLLCVANKKELTHLLRNMDTYMKLNADESCTEESDEGVASNSILLQLGEKHLKLAERLVDIQCNRCRKEGVSSGTKVERVKEQLASSLALCDKETLRSWLHALCVQLGNGATRV